MRNVSFFILILATLQTCSLIGMEKFIKKARIAPEATLTIESPSIPTTGLYGYITSKIQHLFRLRYLDQLHEQLRMAVISW